MVHSLHKAFRLIESRPAARVLDGYSLLLVEILRGEGLSRAAQKGDRRAQEYVAKHVRRRRARGKR
jgi:hypothetical protein